MRRELKVAPALYQLDATLASVLEPRARLGSVGSGLELSSGGGTAGVGQERGSGRLGAMRFVALTPSRSLAVAADDAGHLGAWLPLLRRVHLPTSVHGNLHLAAYSAKSRRDAKLKYAGRSGQQKSSKLLFFKLEAKRGAEEEDSLQVWNSSSGGGEAAALPGAPAAAATAAGSGGSGASREEEAPYQNTQTSSEASSGSEDNCSGSGISQYAWASNELSLDAPGDGYGGAGGGAGSGKPSRKGSKDLLKASKPKGKELWSAQNLEREAKRKAREEMKLIAAAEAALALANERASKQRAGSMDLQQQQQQQQHHHHHQCRHHQQWQ